MESDPMIRRTAPCAVCGCTDYDWGTCGKAPFTNYVPDEDGWFARNFSQLMGTKTVARHCQKCGNIQIFTID
ncbi:MAG: hypothetical protein U0929_00940 [Planctomycetaceae bacterium]